MNIPSLTISGVRPAAVGKTHAGIYLGSKKVLEQMLWATRHTADEWLEIVANAEGDPKQKTLISTHSLELAALRYAQGERPPQWDDLKTFLVTVNGKTYFAGPVSVLKRLKKAGLISSDIGMQGVAAI